MSDPIVVVIGAMWDRSGKFFVAERGYGVHAGKWEFPGGKVERGETDQDALIREWQEELELTPTVHELLWEDEFTLEEDGIPFLARTYRVEVSTPVTPVLSVHKQYRWMYPRALGCLTRMPSLQLPRLKELL